MVISVFVWARSLTFVGRAEYKAALLAKGGRRAVYDVIAHYFLLVQYSDFHSPDRQFKKTGLKSKVRTSENNTFLSRIELRLASHNFIYKYLLVQSLW